MALEIASAAAGFTALALAFRGAVDSYLLLESFFDKDSGVRDQALFYHIECHQLKNWGTRYSIQSDVPEASPLFYVQHDVKVLIMNILGRMYKLQEDGRQYLEMHAPDGSLVKRDLASVDQFLNLFRLGSTESIALSKQQMEKKQRKPVRWIIKNKEKFSGIVQMLGTYNAHLSRLLDSRISTSLEATLPGRALSTLNDPDDLRAVQRLNIADNSLVSHAANLKALKLASGNNTNANLLNAADLKPMAHNPTVADGVAGNPRVLATFKQRDNVWIEWKVIDSGLSTSGVTASEEQIRRLSLMLSEESSARIYTAHCIGIVKDPANNLRQGLVYQVPKRHGNAAPRTLLELIGSMSEPPLGHKFKLAQQLVRTLDLLHASSWIHKAFRSDNVLFFGSSQSHDAILRPYIAGFENSRELNVESLGTRPSGAGPLDYYYHPRVTDGFNKKMDLYSFGVVLLEIAFWRPLSQKISIEKRREGLQAICQLFIATSQTRLPAMMGDIYSTVVRQCLECSLPDISDEKWSSAVAIDIVEKLGQCLA